MAEPLYANATRKDIEEYFKNIYSGTDAVVNESDIDQVVNTIEAQKAWRRSLPIEQQLELSNVPVIIPSQRLSEDNVPVGVTVVDPGKGDTPSSDHQE